MKKIAWICLVTWVAVLVLLAGCKTTQDTPNRAHPAGLVQAADSEDGFATVYVPADRAAKVLLLADPQLDPTQKYSVVGSYNALTLIFLDKLMDATNPDLVIIAGDVVMATLVNNWSYLCQIADIFETKQIPWTFAFGNHDCENGYVSSKANTSSGFGQLTKPKLIEAIQAKYAYCLIYSDECEDGYGNHVVNVRNTKGDLLNTFVNLDCVYDGDSYSHVITNAQTEYYASVVETISRQEGRTIPSIVTTHVALPEMFIGYREAKAGTGEATYYYGELLEGDYSRYVDQSTFFDTMLRLGSTKAVFFGHHHGNDASIEYKGIRLTFVQHSGMSHEYRTDHSKEYSLSGWPKDTVFDLSAADIYGDQRGGVLVTLSQDATYTFAPVYAAEVIPDYAEWAVDYDEVARKIDEQFGAGHVIRGK